MPAELKQVRLEAGLHELRREGEPVARFLAVYGRGWKVLVKRRALDLESLEPACHWENIGETRLLADAVEMAENFLLTLSALREKGES